MDGFTRTNSQMIIDTSITTSSPEFAILVVGCVDVCFWISILLCKIKINNVYQISKLARTHQEVCGLNVAMDEIFVMDIFDARDKLVGKQENRLYREFSIAKVEEVFQAWVEEIMDHDIVFALLPIPADAWYAKC